MGGDGFVVEIGGALCLVDRAFAALVLTLCLLDAVVGLLDTGTDGSAVRKGHLTPWVMQLRQEGCLSSHLTFLALQIAQPVRLFL